MVVERLLSQGLCFGIRLRRYPKPPPMGCGTLLPKPQAVVSAGDMLVVALVAAGVAAAAVVLSDAAAVVAAAGAGAARSGADVAAVMP